MGSNSLGGSYPKRIQISTNNYALKRFIIYHPTLQITSPNVLTLTIRTLEGATKMVPWPSLFVANFNLDLSQAHPIEISWQLYLEIIQRVRGETCSTPSAFTGSKTSSGCAIICADDPRVVRDVLETLLTGHVQVPPLCLCPA